MPEVLRHRYCCEACISNLCEQPETQVIDSTYTLHPDCGNQIYTRTVT